MENEMMFHTAEANGPSGLSKPHGLAINSLTEADPNVPGGWQITTDRKEIQHIPEDEMRFLVHRGTESFMDYGELKVIMDHSDDLTNDQVIDILLADLGARGMKIAAPSDSLGDRDFITLLTRTYDLGQSAIFPPAPEEHGDRMAAA